MPPPTPPALPAIALLLLQIAVILAASRLVGLLFARLRQPQVIGEIIAGLLLGPTLLGRVWPDAYTLLFTNKGGQTTLSMLAQLGVLVFLFLIGLEFNVGLIKKYGKVAAAVSISGIVVPFTLGFLITYPLAHVFDPAHQARLLPTALFMGAAMSVTAFPVLARILTERNLQKTDEGGLAIAAAAIDDVLAWTMLAVVVAFAPPGSGGGGHDNHPLAIIAFAGVYVAAMWFVIRPFLRRVQAMIVARDEVTPGLFAVVLLTMVLSAFFTEMIGVHALFGAFVAGLVMPKTDKFIHEITHRLESFAVTFLLPMFFAYAGLKVDLWKLLRLDLVLITIVLIAVACLGKLGGASAAAYLCGLGRRKSLTLGVLMNTRGLMELIILTVGLELGVINEAVYGMMIIMALVTTGMAGPLITLLLPRAPKKENDKTYSVLIPVSKPDSGGPLMQMASYLTASIDDKRLMALHLKRPTDAESVRSFAADALTPEELAEMEPLLTVAHERNMPVEPMAYFSRDVPADISRTVHQQAVDLVLMGYHTPVWGRSLLGGVVHRVLTGADCDVAVFVDRSFAKPTRVLVPFLGSPHDKLALDLAGRIGRGTGAAITVFYVTPADKADADAVAKAERDYHDPTQAATVTVKTLVSDNPAGAVLGEVPGHDLVVIGVAEEWGLESSLLGLRAERIATECPVSMLIVRRYA